jgi:hypothetical protein
MLRRDREAECAHKRASELSYNRGISSENSIREAPKKRQHKCAPEPPGWES